jgi:hypothetical protein
MLHDPRHVGATLDRLQRELEAEGLSCQLRSAYQEEPVLEIALADGGHIALASQMDGALAAHAYEARNGREWAPVRGEINLARLAPGAEVSAWGQQLVTSISASGYQLSRRPALSSFESASPAVEQPDAGPTPTL